MTYVTVTGETGTFTGVPMTMSTEIFALSFSGSESTAAREARQNEDTRLYSTPSMVTGKGQGSGIQLNIFVWIIIIII